MSSFGVRERSMTVNTTSTTIEITVTTPSAIYTIEIPLLMPLKMLNSRLIV